VVIEPVLQGLDEEEDHGGELGRRSLSGPSAAGSRSRAAS
jgi:hypothetical protein